MSLKPTEHPNAPIEFSKRFSESEDKPKIIVTPAKNNLYQLHVDQDGPYKPIDVEFVFEPTFPEEAKHTIAGYFALSFEDHHPDTGEPRTVYRTPVYLDYPPSLESISQDIATILQVRQIDALQLPQNIQVHYYPIKDLQELDLVAKISVIGMS